MAVGDRLLLVGNAGGDVAAEGVVVRAWREVQRGRYNPYTKVGQRSAAQHSMNVQDV